MADTRHPVPGETLVGAIMLETNDEWTVARRYMRLETITRVNDNPNARSPAVAP